MSKLSFFLELPDLSHAYLMTLADRYALSTIRSFNQGGFSCESDLLLFVLEVPIDHSDLVADLLKELSNHNERVEERKGALLELLKITREDNLGVWEEHFKTILLLLLETLGDKDVRC